MWGRMWDWKSRDIIGRNGGKVVGRGERVRAVGRLILGVLKEDCQFLCI